MLAPALRRHGSHGTFQKLQEALLHAFTAHVASDGGVRSLARNLVDFVDKDNAAFGTGYIVVGSLQQAHDDAVHVLAHVARFGKHRRVGNGKGHVQKARHRLREERLSRAGRADQQQVRLFHLHVVLGGMRLLVAQALVMVVNGHRERRLGGILANHELVQVRLDFRRERERLLHGKFGIGLFLHSTGTVFLDDAVTHGHAVAANLHACARDHLLDTFGGLAAKAANHCRMIFPATIHSGYTPSLRGTKISSMTPNSLASSGPM